MLAIMQVEDQGILLSLRKFSEHAGIATLFTEESGLLSGMVRGAFSSRQRPHFEPGNLLAARWSARLSDQLGTLQCELLQPVAAFFMADAMKLTALQSALQLTERCLIDRDPHPVLYRNLWSLLQTLKFGGDWARSYVEFELSLLSECGFGLELDECAATGQRHDLSHVSPKSGRAVSSEAAAPYRSKLLPLPAFLQQHNLSHSPVEASAILDGARLTGYFIETRICMPHDWNIPPMRQRLMNMMEKIAVPLSVIDESAPSQEEPNIRYVEEYSA